MKKFLLKLTRGDQFWVEKNDSGHKNAFLLKWNPFSEGKEPNPMTRSLLLREILWRHISKTRRAISLKFCIRNAFMDIMIHAKFHFNRLMLTLIFGIRVSEPLNLDERLKWPGLIGLSKCSLWQTLFIEYSNNSILNNLILKPGFHFIVTRSWNRKIQACFDILLRD